MTRASGGQPLIKGLRVSGTPHVPLNPESLEALAAFRERLRAGAYEMNESGCLCGSAPASALLIAEEDRYGLPIRTNLCRSCGLLFTSPRMTEESAARFYENEYRPIYRGSATASEAFFHNQTKHGAKILERVGPFLKSGSGLVVLDIGCGAGGVLQPFQQAGWRAFGCDFNPAYLERGIDQGLQLVAGSSGALRQFGPADLIVASHVLEHCLEPDKEIREWTSMLTAGGLIYIEVPGVLELFQSYKRIESYFHVAHTFHFSLGTLTNLLAEEGLAFIAGDETVWALFSPDVDVCTRPHREAPVVIENFLRHSQDPLRATARELNRHARKFGRSIAKRLRKR